MWLSNEELSNLNKNQIVPNLLDYIRIAITKYDD